MKVGATSDLHGFLPQLPDEQLDLLLIAGDIGVMPDRFLESFPGYSQTLDDFDIWLQEASCPRDRSSWQP